MDRSERLSLAYVMASQAQKHVTVNDTTRALDALVHMSVMSRTLLSEPESPVAGEGYILPSGKTGESWSGFADQSVVVFQDNAWMNYLPTEGMTVYISDEAGHVVWDGAVWAAMTAGAAETAGQFGVNASADTTNKLVVKSDAVLFSHDDVTPGSGDMRTVVNKGAETNTGSVLFQTGYSARAEFGLTGTDDFVIKVSPDGSTFYDAIIIDRTSGAVSFPNTTTLGDGTVETPSFSPTDVSGLSGWWDPSDSSTITYSSGTAVQAIADKSGNAVAASQMDTALQPTLASGALGGMDALSFTGAEYLDLSSLASVFGGEDTAYSVHLVFKAGQTTDTLIPFAVGKTGTNAYAFYLALYSSGDFAVVKKAGTTSSLTLTPRDEIPHFMSIVHTGTTTTVWVDGVRILQDEAQDVSDLDVDNVLLGGWYRSGASFLFEGEIGECLVYNTANTDEEVRQIHRYLGEKWFSLATEADIFVAMGQSNMMGKGDASLSPAVETGAGYEWSTSSFFHSMEDPVPPANSGSCLPAFANAWHSATGRAAFMLNMAVGATALLPEADGGTGNWDETSGSLYATAVTAANAAISSVSDDTIFTLAGIHALWAQGENEAANLYVGTTGVTAAAYETALSSLVTNFAADISTDLAGFYIFELGARDDGAQETAWAEIRGAQQAVATTHTLAHIIYTGCKDFPTNGYMYNTLHYNQAGYNLMGTEGGATAAALS